jgi:hypothetical protein
MATRPQPILTNAPRGALQTLLSQERDPHLRQRALVRASLVACPARGRAPRPLAY